MTTSTSRTRRPAEQSMEKYHKASAYYAQDWDEMKAINTRFGPVYRPPLEQSRADYVMEKVAYHMQDASQDFSRPSEGGIHTLTRDLHALDRQLPQPFAPTLTPTSRYETRFFELHDAVRQETFRQAHGFLPRMEAIPHGNGQALSITLENRLGDAVLGVVIPVTPDGRYPDTFEASGIERATDLISGEVLAHRDDTDVQNEPVVAATQRFVEHFFATAAINKTPPAGGDLTASGWLFEAIHDTRAMLRALERTPELGEALRARHPESTPAPDTGHASTPSL